MRDLETLLQALDKHGFTEYEHVDNLPQDDLWEGNYAEPGFLLHGTTVKSAARIVEEGLKPKMHSLCEIWGEERLLNPGQDLDREQYLLNCREENVFFWDKYYDVMGQAVGSVAYVGEGNPAFLLVDMKGLKIELDPELNELDNMRDAGEAQYQHVSKTIVESHHMDVEATAFMHEGEIDTKRIKCVCFLQDKWYPSIGDILCSHSSKNKNCLFDNLFEFQDNLTDTDSWECRCRANLKTLGG